MSDESSNEAVQFASADFFTSGTFATLAGATAAVVILTNTTTAVAGLDSTPGWLALIFAMGCSVAAYLHAARGKSAKIRKTPRYLRYALVVLNGCLIFSSAFGIQAAIASESVVEVDASVAANTSTSNQAAYTLSSWEPLISFKGTRQIKTIDKRDIAPIRHR